MNMAIPITKALNISYIPKCAMLINDNHKLDDIDIPSLQTISLEDLVFLIPETINTTIYVTVWIEGDPQIILDTLWKNFEKSMKVYGKITERINDGYILHGKIDDVIDSIERAKHPIRECNAIMNNINRIYEYLIVNNRPKEIGNE